MIKHQASHLDHALTPAQVAHILAIFADRQSFFIETITLPPELGTVPCGLYGPTMDDPPIGEEGLSDARVSAIAGSVAVRTGAGRVRLAPRGDRAWPSRLIDAPTRPTRLLTVIAGPHEETCPICDGRGGFGEWKARSPCSCDHGKIKHACILYTAFGGPAAPQEPGDPGCKDIEVSKKFWATHALAAPAVTSVDEKEAPTSIGEEAPTSTEEEAQRAP